MADTNPPGSLFVGDGVFMQGTMQVPGLASIDGKLQGQLSADVIAIQTNGSIDGKTTANHIKVAGSLTDTMVANRSLLVESTGLVAGSITYAEMEIKKGGSLKGSIHKIGTPMPALPAATTEAVAATTEAVAATPAATAAATDEPAEADKAADSN